MVTGELWRQWAERWESFQANYVPEREAQLATVTSYLTQWCPASARVLDLGCGPGSMARRVLAALPRSTTVGLDVDPWLVEIARRTTDGTRATWAVTDLGEPGWGRCAGPCGSFDAVTFTTASHWFEEPALRLVYAEAAGLLARGGPLFVVDLIPDVEDARGPTRLPLERVFAAQTRATRTGDSWPGFWAAAADEPEFAALLEQRERALPPHRTGRFLTVAEHAAALASAGLPVVTQVWRRDASAVLVAFAE